MEKIAYRPGDLFAVPLPSGGYGLILIAYRAKGGYLSKGVSRVFCFGFAGKWDAPSDIELTLRSVLDAICVGKCEEVCIHDGRWTRLGPMPDFVQADWPIPPRRTSGPGEKKPDLKPFEFLRIEVTNSECLFSENPHAAAFVSVEEYLSLPLATGYGDENSMGALLDEALNGSPRARTVPDPSLWNRVNRAVNEQGLLPVVEQPRRGKASPPSAFWNAKVELWNLIEASRTWGEEDKEKFLEAFFAGLIRQGAGRLPWLAREFREHMSIANGPQYWAMAHVMNGGTSPERFQYFRAWFIAQGRENNVKVVWKPDTLASLKLRYGVKGAYEMKELLQAFSTAAERLGVEPPVLVPSGEYLGWGRKLWSSATEAEMRGSVPKVWRRFHSLANGEIPAPRDEQPPRRPPAAPGAIWNPSDEFWNLIEDARARGGEDDDIFIETFQESLAGQGAKRLRLLAKACRKVLASCYSEGVWALAWVLNEGASDDGFLYFRAWLIAQGRENFEKVAAQPDSLASIETRYGDAGAHEMEDLLLAFAEAGDELEIDLPEIAPEESLGDKHSAWHTLTEAHFHNLVPNVHRKYGGTSK